MSKDPEKMFSYFQKVNSQQSDISKAYTLSQEENKSELGLKVSEKKVQKATENPSIVTIMEESKVETEDQNDFTHNLPTSIIDKKIQEKQLSSKLKSSKTKTIQSQPYGFNKLGDKDKEFVFRDIFDENLQLKQNLQVQQETIQKLNTRFKHLNHNYDVTGQSGKTSFVRDQELQLSKTEEENQRLKEKLRLLSQTDTYIKSKNFKTATDPQSKKNAQELTELRRLTSHLKQQLLTSQQQIKLMQQTAAKNPTMQFQTTNHNASSSEQKKRMEDQSQYIEQLRREIEKYRAKSDETLQQLRQEQLKINDLSVKNREMEQNALLNKDLNQQINEIRTQKEAIEHRLKLLCQDPFVKQHENAIDVKVELLDAKKKLETLVVDNERMKSSENQLKKESAFYKGEYEKLSDQQKVYIQEIAQLQSAKDNPNAKGKGADLSNDDEFMRKLGLLKWNGETPTWLKVDLLNRPEVVNENDFKGLQQEIERLKVEKADLAAQLDKTQTLLRLQIEIDEDYKKVSENEKHQFTLQVKQCNQKIHELKQVKELYNKKTEGEFFQRNGIKYDDNVSEFSVDYSPQDTDTNNYLDIFLGDANLDELAIRQLVPNFDNMKNPLSFLTVDFYNHDTVHTGITEGLQANYDFQLSFKVVVDEFFIMFLETESLSIELYVSNGSEAIKIGTAEVELKDLVVQNKNEDISAVCKLQAQFYGLKNESIGIMSLKARMRQPIADTINWMQEKRKLGLIEDYEVVDKRYQQTEVKKLLFKIEKASGFPSRSNTFAFYNFCGKDVHTLPMKGSNPLWNHITDHQVVYDQKFQKSLKVPLEITIFDDTQPMNGKDDLLGTAKINLKGLIDNEIINQEIEVRGSKNERVGYIFIRAFWFQSTQKMPFKHETQLTQIWEEDVTIKITNKLRSKQQTVQSAFKLMDCDGDTVISLQDLKKSIVGFLNLPELECDLEMYFQCLPNPLSEYKFQEYFGKYLINTQDKNETENMKSMKQIKDILHNNNMQIQKDFNSNVDQNKQNIQPKISNEDDLLNKILQHIKKYIVNQKNTMKDLFKKIDKDGDRHISRDEFRDFTRHLNLFLTPLEESEFFDRFDTSGNNNISLDEFASFIKPELQNSFQQETIDLDEFKRLNNIFLKTIFDKVKNRKNPNLVAKLDFYDALRNAQGAPMLDEQILEVMNDFEEANMINWVKFLKINESQTEANVKLLFTEMKQVIKDYNLDSMEVFKRFDANNDYTISPSEFKTALTQMGCKFEESQLKDMIKFISKGNNEINYHEFVKQLKNF